MTSPYPVPAATEEPLGSVTRVLGLAAGDGEDLFTGGSLPQLSGRVYGGQVVAQGMLAAAATVDDDGDGERLPHSVHAFFMRGGQPDKPISFAVERLHDGRSFSQRRTAASQEGTSILTMLTSFQEEQEGADIHVTAPSAPRPEDLTSALEIFRTIDHPVARFLGRTAAFDLRHVEDNLYLRPAKERAGRQHLWMRSRSRIPEQTSQTVHRALLAYVCDQVMLEPVLRSQGLSWRSEGMSLAGWCRPSLRRAWSVCPSTQSPTAVQVVGGFAWPKETTARSPADFHPPTADPPLNGFTVSISCTDHTCWSETGEQKW